MLLSEYFQSYKDYFWQWEDDGEVIAIPSASTIAYKDLIAQTLGHLSPFGIPPFGSLLLTIIATNPDGRRDIDAVYSLVSTLLRTTDDPLLSHVVEFLKLLSELPASCKTGKKRLQLLQLLFENCHSILGLKTSKYISDSFINNKYAEGELFHKKDFHHQVYQRDFKTISVLANRFKSAEEIVERLAALPGVEVDLPEAVPVTRNDEKESLTEQLIRDAKTFHVGSLLKHIWGGLNIPLHSTLPSQQPLGGIADLTNKGDFDRLLVSEFANPDLVLMSRLANNEALYIRREIPPASNDVERILLADISLKNWGIPKTVAFATMLAIAKHPKTDIPCRTFLVGREYFPVSLDSAESIIEGLQLVDSGLHAAEGLESFFKTYSQPAHRELFFLTEPSTLKHPAMQKILADHHRQISYWIFTNNGGDIDIYKRQQGSKRLVQHIRLPLEKLWQREPKAEPAESKGLTAHYPFLFRNTWHVKAVIPVNQQLFIVSTDHMLYRNYDPAPGNVSNAWELLLEGLPRGASVFEIGVSIKGEYLFLMFDVMSRELTLLSLVTGEQRTFTFSWWMPTTYANFVYHGNKFYHANGKGCWSIDFSGIESVEWKPPACPTKEVFTQRVAEREKARSHLQVGESAFRNVKAVFINNFGKLVLNKHELHVNPGGHLKLDPCSAKEPKIHAQKNGNGEFLFPDGSLVRIGKPGFIYLQSSNSHLPGVYIHSKIDASLAVAANNIYAGPKIYFPELQYNLVLHNPGGNKIEVMRFLHAMTGHSLDRLKEVFVHTPCTVAWHLSHEKAKQVSAQLEKSGATISIEPSRPDLKEMEMVPIDAFYKDYIVPFIDQISGTWN